MRNHTDPGPEPEQQHDGRAAGAAAGPDSAATRAAPRQTSSVPDAVVVSMGDAATVTAHVETAPRLPKRSHRNTTGDEGGLSGMRRQASVWDFIMRQKSSGAEPSSPTTSGVHGMPSVGRTISNALESMPSVQRTLTR